MKTIPQLLNIPEKPEEIHHSPCKQCPSTHNLTEDLEIQDLLLAPKEIQKETAFVCAWRTTKLCKGYCDVMGLKQEDFK